MEGDSVEYTEQYEGIYFNPLPPHGGRPVYELRQFTPYHISIHSLRMEGDFQQAALTTHGKTISIHSLRMEGDFRRRCDVFEIIGFQSTPSAWRETALRVRRLVPECISIHSLRMEGDTLTHPRKWHGLYFNPLPPHGGRLSKDKNSPAYDPFQSTPSAWRETRLEDFQTV